MRNFICGSCTPLDTLLLEEALGQSEILIVLRGLEPIIEILIVPLNSMLSAAPDGLDLEDSSWSQHARCQLCSKFNTQSKTTRHGQ